MIVKKESCFLVCFLFFLLLSSLFCFVDRPLFFYFNSLSPDIKKIFCCITRYGRGEYYLIPSCILFLLCCILGYRRKSLYCFLVFLSVIFSGLVVNILKILFARYRPKALLETGSYGFHFFDCGYVVNSFPSGHAAATFSAFVALSIAFPRYKYFFWFCATVIAFSRVVIGSHYLSDVLFGSLIGILTPYLLMYYMEKHKSKIPFFSYQRSGLPTLKASRSQGNA